MTVLAINKPVVHCSFVDEGDTVAAILFTIYNITTEKNVIDQREIVRDGIWEANWL